MTFKRSKSCVAVLISLTVLRYSEASPVPPPVLVNEATQECVQLDGAFGDECWYCWIRQGWKSIGHFYAGIECPEGYSSPGEEFDAYHCFGIRAMGCCSDGFSGYGDCEYLIVNEVEEQCSISLCSSLPEGWTRKKLCLWEYEWVEPEDIACEDPCKDLSCGNCIDANCSWSFKQQRCFPACQQWEWPPCLSTSRWIYGEFPSPHGPLGGEFLCEEYEQVHRDNEVCEAKTSCSDCTTTFLPSNELDTCRWANTCDDKRSTDTYCEGCFASSCGEWPGYCNEMTDCSTSNICEADTCTTCLDQGCHWILGEGPSCFHTCPGNEHCAHPVEGTGSADACKDLEDDFWDMEFCVVKNSCNNCLQSALPSNVNNTCKWFVEPDQVYRRGRCHLECPRYWEACEEVNECRSADTRPCFIFQSCGDCLGEGCFWFEEEYMDRWAFRCGEECSPNATTCLSPQDIPDDATLLEYCLNFGYGHPWSYCNVSYPYTDTISQPCTHCLFNGCAWDDGGCRDSCTNGTVTCTTAADLKGSDRLERKISTFCETVETSQAVDCDQAISNATAELVRFANALIRDLEAVGCYLE